jgi:hypothetical protein
MMSSSQHNRTSSYIPPSSIPQTVPRKRNLSASAIPLRPPPNLRTPSTPATPQPVVKEEEDEDDGKDDYGDIGVNNGENRDEETKEERERLRYHSHSSRVDVEFYWRISHQSKCSGTKFLDVQTLIKEVLKR